MKELTYNNGTALAVTGLLLAAPVIAALLAGPVSVASVAVALLLGVALVAAGAYFASALALSQPRGRVAGRLVGSGPALGGC